MTSIHVGKLPFDHPAALPQEGMTYTDARGRTLKVDRVQVRDPLGREVVGTITWPGMAILVPVGVSPLSIRPGVAYATDVSIWAHVWRDKDPPADRSKMKVGG